MERVNAPGRRTGAIGFTLIELLVVVVILGILAAVVVFAVGGINDRGKRSACRVEARTFATAVQSYRAQYDDTTPPGATVNAVADSLVDARFLTTSVLGYHGGAQGWNYSVASGDVDATQCAD